MMSKQDLYKELEKFLNDRVWVTKKTRIEAEARMRFNNTLSDILINYYTFAVLAFSIWTLVLEPSSTKASNITLSTVILSVGLFGITLLLSSIGFKKKAIQFKESHLKLDSLEGEIRNLKRLIDFKTEQEIIGEMYDLEKKYNDILALTDNHSNVDFQKLVVMRKLGGVNKGLSSIYYLKVIAKWMFLAVLFFLPPLLAYIVSH